MATKIRNVELLTLARSDAGTPVLGHVGVGIDANLIQDFEMGLSRVSSAAQFNLALNTEGATTNTAHFGGIAFTQGASADTVMASIKAVNTSVDGYIDLAFNTRSVDNALLIKANGDVSINNANASLTINATSSYPFINFEENGTVRFQQAYDITNDLAYFLCNQSGSQMWFGVNNAEVMRLSDGKVGIGITNPTAKLELYAVNTGSSGNSTTLLSLHQHDNSDLSQQKSLISFKFTDANNNATPQVQIGAEVGENADANSQTKEGSGAFIVKTATGTGTTTNSLTEKMRVSHDGTVGIGVAAPSDFHSSGNRLVVGDGSGEQGLTVYSSSSSAGVINFADSNSGTARYVGRIYYDHSDNKMNFSVDGSTRSVITSTGLGIGTTAPSSKVHLSEADSGTSYYYKPQLRLTNTNTTDNTGESILYTSSADIPFAAIEGKRTDDSTHTGDLIFRVGSNATPVPERLRITSDGKVGIGTGSSTPSETLSVVGDGSFTKSAAYPELKIKRTGSYSGTDSIGNIFFYADTDSVGGLGMIRDGADDAAALQFFTQPTGGANSERLRISADGKVGIGTGSSSPSQILEIKSSSQTKLLINRDAANDAELEFKNTEQSWTTGIDRSNSNAYTISTGTSLGSAALLVHTNGKVGVGTGSTTLTELLEVNGNAKATKFIGALEGTLETARNIVVGKSSAGAGDIDAITQSFDGGANISFDSELNSHLPSNLRATTSSNIADEPSNNAVKIIGSDINTPRLKINRQGLIVGFEEVATSGGGGSGGISALTLNTNGLLYLNSGFTTQTETTSTSTPSLNLYLNAAGLFTAASMSFDNGGAYQSVLSLTVGGTTKTVDLDYDGLFTALTESSGTMSMTIGNTTKTLDLPNASFTQLDLSGTTLQVTVGGTQRTRDLSGLSVATATNATNAANVRIITNADNSTRYLTFVTGTSGDRQLLVDTDITYNPSTNTLATTNFSGALSGNATTSSGLLVGSTTYSPVFSATGNTVVIRNSAGDINARYLLGTYVNTSDNVQNSNISYIMAKFGDNYHRSATADKVRAFLGSNRFLPTPSGGVYNITVSNATSATSASNATTATRLLTTTNGVVKTTGGNGTLSIGSLSSGDIPDNAADTSGNAATATKAGGLISGTDTLPASFVGSSTNTIVARGTSGEVSVGAVSCTSISASTSITSSTTITAQKIVATNTTDSIRAKDIRPNGTVSTFESGPFPPLFYGVTGSKIGDHTSSSIGGFENLSAFNIFYQYGQAFSDRRMKDNISDFDLGLDFIRLLQPKSYTYKGSETPRNHYGVIAQDIEEIVSSLNIENPSFVSLHDYHNKTEEENEAQLKSYDPQQIMWVLFNAVKQLDAEVQDLKKQLEEK